MAEAHRPTRGGDTAARPVLVAPDSFKGTFTAFEVAGAIADGMEQAGVPADRCPVADGGEGTVEVLLPALGAERRGARVADPLGRLVTADWAYAAASATALVETAAASGLALVRDRPLEPERASTVGTGELIAEAVAAGASTILLGVGGSATTDGGAGALEVIERAGGLRGARLIVLCDVTTPLERAAIEFGPQKGADEAAVERLTARLLGLAESWPRDPRGVPMTGAAGGLAGGLWAVLGAGLVAGAPFVLDALGFAARLARARAVVIGEGRLDAQSLRGKITGTIAAAAATARVPVHAVVGGSELGRQELAALGLASVRVASTLEELTQAGAELAARVR
jgi:glycerate kinase